ncbi:MAG TPA: 4Fe-4S dicluster domain-containing protein, partial [Nonomuraea sp.]|nr:4Fe-4S dicluster domain-containing protein [Nonomuraea sp.]
GATSGVPADPKVQTFLRAVTDDLKANPGASLVIADEYASPAVQVLVHAINQALGNAGKTVIYTEPVEVDPQDSVQSLAELVADMNAGRVDVLLMLDGANPVYTAPADLPFAEALRKVPLRIHHGLYQDETSENCQWHIPAAHELESWSDARSFDGTVSLIQPLIDPLYGGKSAHEVLGAFSNQPDATGYDILRQYWSTRLPGLSAGLSQAASNTAGSGGITTTLGMGGFSGSFSGKGGGAEMMAPSNPNGSGRGNGAGGAAGGGAMAAGGGNPPGNPAGGTAAPGLGVAGSNGTNGSSTAAAGAGTAATASATGGAAGGAFDTVWRQALHAGLIPATTASRTTAAVNGGAVAQAAGEVLAAVGRAQPGQITLLLRPDPTVWDGRFASNAWLQELPKPISKLTWDNALMLAPKTAERLKVTFHDTVEVSVGGRKLEAAVWILPGVAEDTAVLTLGYGRKRAGSGTGRGFNAYALRASNALWTAPGAQIRPLGGRYTLACTQNHHMIRGHQVDEDDLASEQARERNVIRTGTLEEFRRDPDFLRKQREVPEKSMYPQYPYPGHAWGMGIDLNVCTGCSSCVIACQSENNIPVVGKDQVLAGREMHWLRIDRYFAGDLDAPSIHNQPLPCMHCETAPCEVVCPVAATVHSQEGLNDMVYNRCVGTRYCSNNCPYKVRRFNFLRYSDKDTPVLELVNNPDVTVRMRGVMEKCTYCVQRIEQAKIESKVEREPIPANWLQTACQQACPTQAIVFGDLNDTDWEVRKWRDEPLNYGLLEELNTRPRTTYLAKLRNPNPALEPAEGAEHGHA